MLNPRQKMARFFRSKHVTSMQILQQQLDNRSQRSIFRDLSKEGYYSSYTHAGKYYTLQNIPDFNSDGLWFYEDIGFSKYGTIKDTTIFLVNNSASGKTHGELKRLLRIRVHNALLELVKLGKIVRKQCNHFYVYVSAEKELAKQQLDKRQILKAAELPSELMQIKIFIEIIKCGIIEIDSSLLTSRLKACGVNISVKEVEKILIFYDLKKN